jgi:uncharacterized protein (DUF2235 family)
MRRLVVLADGTWKSDRDTTETLTNVVKLRDALAPVGTDGISQIKFYTSGVGVGSIRKRVKGGIFGDGLEENILECYRFLVHNFTPDDRLYLFGFSRGAYTVRSLAGMVRKCGILKSTSEADIHNAYDFYRDRRDETRPSSELATRFRAEWSHEAEIHCVGVWDTVGSLGIPTGGPIGMLSRQRHGFHDVRLSSRVRNAFHAIAIDERRKPFAPALWEMKESDMEEGQRVEQHWFCGVHSNVGGGYRDTSISDLTLDWMVRKASECGLQFRRHVVEALRGNAAGIVHESMTLGYRLFGTIVRKIDEPRWDPETGERLLTFEAVDDSVELRCKTVPPGYEAANFLDYQRRMREG